MARPLNGTKAAPGGQADAGIPGTPAATERLANAPPMSGALGLFDKPVDYDARKPDYGEFGLTGLKQFSGRVYEEFLPQLQPDLNLAAYLEMSTNSSVIRSALFAIDMLMRQVDWRVEPPVDGDTEAQAATALVESAFEDMSRSWQDTLSEILSFIVYGWSLHELVYKRRDGTNPIPGLASRHADGMIGWRKWPIRAQVARWRWSFDPTGGVQGQWQIPPPDYVPRFIPMQKALLFRTQIHKDNPEGVSVLRGAWQAYYFAKRIKEFEAIGVERNLDGLPVIEVPAEITHQNATADQQALYTSIKQMIRDVRMDARMGVIIPQSYDPETKLPLFNFKLMAVTGRGRQVDTEAIIQRYNKEMAMTMLADFLFLGQQNVGSFALASSKTALFSQAIGAFLDSICGVVNRHAIPRLLGLNGYALDSLPVLAHGDIEHVDPDVLGKAFQSLAAAGFNFSGSPKLARWILEQYGAPHELGGEMQEHLEEQANLEAEQQAAERAAAVALATETAARAKAGELPTDKPEPQPAIKLLRDHPDVAKREEPHPLIVSPNISVHLPEEMRFPTPPTPNIYVTVPEGPAPQVTVQPPDVHVTSPDVHVHVPEQPMPSITVEAPQITVHAPDAKATKPMKRVTEVFRDKDGEIVKTFTEDLPTDPPPV